MKNRHDLMRSGKHKAFGGNVQVLTDESGYPLWVSPVSPGSVHDITAAGEHVLDAISTVDISVLADKGYIGAGHNVHTPIRGRNLADDEYEYNPESERIASTSRTSKRHAQTTQSTFEA
ncbi:transposase family protein [Corynebacterium felinum]|nr:transposase family protein [Corynebacterium felinum]MDF5820769.1 transposase family protein [Corynebacterium felinum]